MTMTVYKPFEGLFDSGLNFSRNHRSCFEGDFPVRMDMVESKDGFVIYAELPGMEKSDIKLSVENGILTISGERKRDEKEDLRRVLSERFFGSFKRSFRLNDSIATDGITADFKNGLLVVTLPLKEETKPRHIEVSIN